MDAASSQTPEVRQRTCTRCDGLTDRPVLVSEVHQNSGPGFSVYACADCAPHFPALPDAAALLPDAGEQRAEGAVNAGTPPGGASRMTLHTYRLTGDGQRVSVSGPRTVAGRPDPERLAESMAWPPCRCPRCVTRGV